MALNKQKIYLITAFIILVILLAGGWFFGDNIIKKKPVTDNWNDINYIFNIEIPADFDQYKIERLNEKISEAKKAFVEKPGDNWTWVMIGNMYEFVRDYERALVAYHKSLAIVPNDISATLNIATISEEQFKNYTEAEKYYSQAIAIFPQMPDLYDRLALLYWRKMNRPEDAETTYLQSLDQSGGHLDALLDLINFYEKTNQTEKMLPYVKKLLDAYPDNEAYQRDFGHLIK